jgi:hypothetical protein
LQYQNKACTIFDMRTNHNTLARRSLNLLLVAMLGGGAVLGAGACEPRTGSSSSNGGGSGDSGGEAGGGGSGSDEETRHVSDMGRPAHNKNNGKKNSNQRDRFDCTYMQAEAIGQREIRITAEVYPMPAGPILEYEVQSSRQEIEGSRWGDGITVDGNTISTTLDASEVGRDPRAFVKIVFPVGSNGNFGGASCDADGV